MLPLKVHPVSLFQEKDYPALPTISSAAEGEIVGVEMSFTTKDGEIYVSPSLMERIYIRQGDGITHLCIGDCPEDLKARAIRAWWALACETPATQICRNIHSIIPDDMSYTRDTCGYSLVAFANGALIIEEDAPNNIFEGEFFDEDIDYDALGKAVRVLVPAGMSSHHELEARVDLGIILAKFSDNFTPLDRVTGEPMQVVLPSSLRQD